MCDILDRHQGEEGAKEYFVKQRWPDGIRCPRCNHDEVCDAHMRRSSRRRKKMWKCRKCAHKFTVTSGTVMEGTKLPLRKWMQAYHELGGLQQRDFEVNFSYTDRLNRSHKTRCASVRIPIGGTDDYQQLPGQVQQCAAQVRAFLLHGERPR